MMKKKYRVLLTSLTLFYLPIGFCVEGLDEELRFLQAETYVITATKTLERTEQSVATVSVIPEEQIHQMGARNLLDILKTVPGLGISQTATGVRSLEVRGIRSTFSERVLIMLNGHPADHNIFWGGSMWTYDDMPVENIKRVEVIRGPGSALYGANAFLATINVITKEARDVDGVAVAVGGGSFDTQQYNVLAGKEHGSWHGMANAHYSTTDGPQSYIAQDTLNQSGRTHLYEKRNDLEWRFGYGRQAVIDGRFINKTTGSFAGPAAFLSDDTRLVHDDYFLRLTLEHDLSDHLTLTTRVYRDFFEMDQLLELRKNQFNRLFADSIKTGGELQTTYRISPANTLIGGFTYELQEQRNTSQQTGSSPYRLSSFLPFTMNTERSLWGGYLEDLWDITSSVRLTSGARYDQYSDFGGTFNPRIGFNWAFLSGYSARFAYGSAFRAPTFSELYTVNNPSVMGNPSLQPETINTYEVGINMNWNTRWSGSLTLFRNDIADMIGRQVFTDDHRQVLVRYNNLAGINSLGLEWMIRYALSDQSYLSANYSYQDSRFISTQRRVPDVPEHRAILQANLAVAQGFYWYNEIQIRGNTTRAAGDVRADNPAYALVNTTIRITRPHPNLELSFSVFNLMDSNAGNPFIPSVPDDLPLPDRTFFARLRYDFGKAR